MFDELALTAAVASNISIAGVLRTLGRAWVGTNYNLVRKEVDRLGLDISHWKGQSHGTSGRRMIRIEAVLCEGSTYRIDTNWKTRLIVDGWLKNQCAICNSPPTWEGRPLTLRLDHINGIRNDNRVVNLRLLCPNCDSQTDTFCGRNAKHPKKYCSGCKKQICAESTWCVKCFPKFGHCQKTRINWPPTKELHQRIDASSISSVARELGVSDNAIRKRIKNHP